jgi:damage-control phosphatase, subfamily III
LSGGADCSQENDPFHQITELKSHILIDHQTLLFNYIYDRQAFLLNFDVCIEIILDNAGFELLTDLCLADFLVSKGLCSRVIFHVKSFPWFVSDATKIDFFWLLEQLSQSSASPVWQLVSQRWREHLRNGQWKLQTHRFFTLPYDYSHMQDISSELYYTMSQSSLLIFKGDLNYRKLVGDRRWPLTEPFARALGNFHPTSLVALRTCKADVQVELDMNLVEQVTKLDPKWMVNGKWAVVQALLKNQLDNSI